MCCSAKALRTWPTGHSSALFEGTQALSAIEFLDAGATVLVANFAGTEHCITLVDQPEGRQEGTSTAIRLTSRDKGYPYSRKPTCWGSFQFSQYKCDYALVNKQFAIENGHLCLIYPWNMVIFHSFLLTLTRGYPFKILIVSRVESGDFRPVCLGALLVRICSMTAPFGGSVLFWTAKHYLPVVPHKAVAEVSD